MAYQVLKVAIPQCTNALLQVKVRHSVRAGKGPFQNNRYYLIIIIDILMCNVGAGEGGANFDDFI